MTWLGYAQHGWGIGAYRQPVYHPVHTATAPSTGLAVSVSDVREHLGYGSESDAGRDAELEAFIRAAQTSVEDYCGDLCLLTTTWRADIPALDLETTLRKRPFGGLTSLQYVRATDGEILTVDTTTYHVLAGPQMRSSIFLGEDVDWPTDAANRRDAYRITYTAGWADADSIPKDIRLALLMIVAKFDANRGDCDESGAGASVYAMKNANASAFPPGAVALLDRFKLREIWAA